MVKISQESFEDTLIAFKYKSNWSLKKSYYIFNIVNHPWMASLGTSMVRIALALRLPVKGMIKATVFEHFCGGETIESSRPTIDMLVESKVGAILDYSVEGEITDEVFDQTMEETIRTIENASKNPGIPFGVFKPTGLGSAELMEKVEKGVELSDQEKQQFETIRVRYEKICKKGFELNVPILIDAEETWYQSTVDNLVNDMMRKFNKNEAIVYNTYQMYRHASLDNLKNAVTRAKEEGFILGAKLVRGAYMEAERERAEEMGYEDPICKDKEATDLSYNQGLKVCVDNIERVRCFSGSHNEHSNLYLTELLEKHNHPHNDKRVCFAQLYGMSDNITFNLAKAGYNVAKYLPYGPVRKVMPYLLRRAEENTSVAGQSSRELLLLKTEINRRKKARG